MSSSEIITKSIAPMKWSQDQSFYIQLYTELLFAATRLPQEPFVFLNDTTFYARFHSYFTDSGGERRSSSEHIAPDLRELVEKRDRLVSGVMWRINKSAADKLESGKPKVRGVAITPALLAQYQDIRKKLGSDKIITHPEDEPELWKFLVNEATNQYCNMAPVLPAAVHGNPSQVSALAVEKPITPLSTMAKPINPSIEKGRDLSEEIPGFTKKGTTSAQTKKVSQRQASVKPKNVQVLLAKRAKTAEPATQKASAAVQVSQEVLPRTKKNTKWTDNEFNALFRCINKFCKDKGIDQFSIAKVAQICADAIAQECPNEPHGVTRTKEMVYDKIRNFANSQSAELKDHAMETLIKNAAEVKKALEDRGTVDRAIQHPDEVIPLLKV
jgi:hypothetical protein